MTKKLFKRGMSPIIATMLLIALAVSIGATVMSLGGVYYEKLTGGNTSCSKMIINVFELEKNLRCKDYEFNSIINFNLIDETAATPECYSGIATGKGDICLAPKAVFGSSWAPIGHIIK